MSLLALMLAGCTDATGHLCTFFCTDTTQLQRTYVEGRDHCRQYAELKAEMMPQDMPVEPGVYHPPSTLSNATKTRLVGLFSECMNYEGWSIPGPDDKNKKAPEAPLAIAAAPAPRPEAMNTARQSAQAQEEYTKRAAECAFARQSADVSIIARKRADACELECRQWQKYSPDAPRPAACP